MRKSIFIALIPSILFFSCSRSKFFYRANKQTGEISMENAIVTKTFLNSDKNKKISVTHIFADGEKSNRVTIFFIPPNGGNSTVLAKLMQALVNRGYNIYLFDYEGYGESEGKADNMNVLKDAQLVLDYVISNKIDNHKLWLWGFSLGGNLAVKLVLENHSQIDALIMEGAFTSHRDIARVFAPSWLKWAAGLVRSPYPSKKLIKKIQLPIFIAHSINDKVCPFSMGETLYNNANHPKFFLKLSGEHCYGLLQETDIYIENLEFFLMNNK
jgi:alpha-beta hydrolase superfamily lysophospholipase